MATKKSADLKAPTGKATTAVAVRKPMNVASIQETLKAQAAAMADRTAPPSGSKITVTQDKRFKLPNGQVVTELDAVIVDFRAVHNFYEGDFDRDNIVPPNCFAIGINPKQMTPSANSPDKQHDNCQSCPLNQFGSNGKGKACGNGRKLALLPPTDDGKDVDHEADMWTLNVSSTALKGFDGYVQTLARTFQSPPVGFLTHIAFNDNLEYPSLVFSDPRPVNSLGEALSRQDEAKEMLEAEPDVSSFGVEKPKAARAPARKQVGARR